MEDIWGGAGNGASETKGRVNFKKDELDIGVGYPNPFFPFPTW